MGRTAASLLTVPRASRRTITALCTLDPGDHTGLHLDVLRTHRWTHATDRFTIENNRILRDRSAGNFYVRLLETCATTSLVPPSRRTSTTYSLLCCTRNFYFYKIQTHTAIILYSDRNFIVYLSARRTGGTTKSWLQGE